jgi:diguanylate cyclase (GGDEF)-like protein
MGKPKRRLLTTARRSIGVALFFGHEASKDEILKWADAAMYQAKASGRDRVRFYDPNAKRRL